MPSVTLTSLQASVYAELDANNIFYSPFQVNLAINQVLRRLNLITGFSQATIAIPGFSVANQYLYSTPAGILIPLHVYFEKRKLATLSLAALARKYRSWITDTTSNIGPVARWSAVGLLQFVIHPADANGGGLLEVSGIAPITPLVNGNNVVNLPDEFTDILVKYAAQRVQLKEGGLAFSNAMGLYQKMAEEVGYMMRWQESYFPDKWVLVGQK